MKGSDSRIDLVRVILYSVSILLAIVEIASARTTTRIYKENLFDPVEVEFSIADQKFVWISATQKSGDIFLEIFDSQDNQVRRGVNISSHKGLDEYLLVETKDCGRCTLLVNGVLPIDKAGPLEIVISTYDRNSPDLGQGVLELMQGLTNVGEIRYRAEKIFEKENYSELMKAFVTRLEALTTVNLTNEYTFLTLHARTLLSESLFYAGREDEQKKVLSMILDESSPKLTKYHAQAFYEIAPLQDDVLVQLELYDKGISIASQLNDLHLLAMGQNYKATALIRNGQFKPGVSLLKESFGLFWREGRKKNSFEPLHNLSWAHQQSGEFSKSISYATQQKLLANKLGFDEHIIWSLYNLGRSYRGLGHWFEAEQTFDEALLFRSSLTVRNRTSLALSKAYLLKEKVEGLTELGAFELASDLVKELRNEYAEQSYQNRLIETVVTEGEIAFAKQDFAMACEKFIAARNYYNENNRIRQEGAILLKQVELELERQNFIVAADFQSEALELVSQTQDYQLLANAFNLTAEVLHKLNRNQDALALLTRVDGFVFTYSDDINIAKFHSRRAQINNAVGKRNEALIELESSRKIIADLLAKVRRRDLRQYYLALNKSIYELSIDIMLDTNPTAALESLKIAESYKAQVLEERIRETKSLQRGSEAQRRKREEIHSRIHQEARNWYAHQSPSSNAILASARRMSAELENLELQINDLHRSDLSLSAVTHELLLPSNPSQLVVYYFLGTKKSWIWTIFDGLVKVEEVVQPNDMTKRIASLKNQFSQPPSLRTGSTAWEEQQNLITLSRILLSPIYGIVKQHKIDLLTVIADGLIHGLPFSALLSEDNKTRLIESHAITYLPSLESMVALQQRSLPAVERLLTDNVLVVANPISSTSSESGESGIPFTQDEADTIKAVLGSSANLLVGTRATKNELKRQLNENFGILHIATHGLLNNDVPALSGLRVSDNNQGQGIWLASEISSSDLNVALVVLSACETSVGKPISGEGFMSLTRSFLVAGARQVIGTLWKVEDRTTSRLMADFYHELSEQQSAASALRIAQLSAIKAKDFNRSDPYYWAGFQLQGTN